MEAKKRLKAPLFMTIACRTLSVVTSPTLPACTGCFFGSRHFQPEFIFIIGKDKPLQVFNLNVVDVQGSQEMIINV